MPPRSDRSEKDIANRLNCQIFAGFWIKADGLPKSAVVVEPNDADNAEVGIFKNDNPPASLASKVACNKSKLLTEMIILAIS